MACGLSPLNIFEDTKDLGKLCREQVENVRREGGKGRLKLKPGAFT